MLFADCGGEVECIIKINENYHKFKRLKYIRADGLSVSYSPDFIVKIEGDIYLAETKAEKDVRNTNVKQKQKSALDWGKKINGLNPCYGMFSIRHYSLISDKKFYYMKNRGGSAKDLLESCAAGGTQNTRRR